MPENYWGSQLELCALETRRQHSSVVADWVVAGDARQFVLSECPRLPGLSLSDCALSACCSPRIHRTSSRHPTRPTAMV